jgi:hypothetical protein
MELGIYRQGHVTIVLYINLSRLGRPVENHQMLLYIHQSGSARYPSATRQISRDRVRDKAWMQLHQR